MLSCLRRRPLLRNAFFAALVVGSMLDAAPALAQSADVRSAGRKFAEGERAFRAGDYSHAAESFEAAYAEVPHADALWNAARAWDRAGELAAAANLYARYLHEAPPSAADRNSATAALQRLAGRLGRIELHVEGYDDVRIDDRPAVGARVYVDPGRHRVTARRGDAIVEETAVLGAGEGFSVAFAPARPDPGESVPPPKALPAPDVVPAPVSSSVEAPAASSGWSPTVVWIGGGLTALGAGVTVWSGFDTLAERDAFLSSPSQEELDRGREKQLRTNIALGVTAGLAALTLFTAVALVDWRGSRRSARLEAGAGSVLLRGTFD